MSEKREEALAVEMARTASDALTEKKGADVAVLRVTEQTVLADYFVIATGTSSTHVRALADEAEFKMGEAGFKCGHIEGRDEWILLDYGSVIVHVFTKAAREFYKLEKLWGDVSPVQTDRADAGEGEAKAVIGEGEAKADAGEGGEKANAGEDGAKEDVSEDGAKEDKEDSNI